MDLMNELNAGGALYLTHTKVDGYVLLRLAIGGAATERRHVTDAWDLVRLEHRRLVLGAASHA